ncbi:MAG TPA: hypothetical protein VK968_17830 [Roseimicrobium sp.]|nr:hypothetical protein [Roseimicrobium sp.]
MNNLRTILAFIAAWTLVVATATAQAPDPGEGREIWRGRLEGREFKVIQLPRNATALIPMRFLIEETGSPASALALLNQIDAVDVRVLKGREAALSYAPRRLPIQMWEERLAEVRETFRTPGTYELELVSASTPGLKLRLPVVVDGFGYLGFGEEFGFFVLGCLVLGAVFLFIITRLHRRMPPSRPAPGIVT